MKKVKLKDGSFIKVGEFHDPSDGRECPEVINSFGKSCGKKKEPCPLTSCYRWGWTEKEVAADNKELVKLLAGRIS